jgi:hypothetical protein
MLSKKWMYVIGSAVLFLILVSPISFKLTNSLTSAVKWETSVSGCPNIWGVVLHTVIFALAVFLVFMLENRELERFTAQNDEWVAIPSCSMDGSLFLRESEAFTIDSDGTFTIVPLILDPDAKPFKAQLHNFSSATQGKLTLSSGLEPHVSWRREQNRKRGLTDVIMIDQTSDNSSRRLMILTKSKDYYNYIQMAKRFPQAKDLC